MITKEFKIMYLINLKALCIMKLTRYRTRRKTSIKKEPTVYPVDDS